MLCIFPQQGIFFKWWEDHAFLLMLGLLGMGLLFFFLNARRLMMVSFATCALLCLILQERSQMPLRHSEKTEDSILIIGQFELPSIRSYDDESLHLILDTKADILSLQGVELASLDKMHDFFTCCGYPYFECLQNEAHQTAMVIYSRYPFSFLSQVNDPNAQGMLTRIEWHAENKTQELFFFNAFINPASDEWTQAQMRKRLQNYAHRLSLIEKPLLVCGDYNLVSWSKDLYTFRTVAGLKESRRGLLPSLPYGHFSLWDFPFDHIFYSNQFKCLSFETISSSTDSHLGIVGTFQFENQDTIVNVKTTSQEF